MCGAEVKGPVSISAGSVQASANTRYILTNTRYNIIVNIRRSYRALYKQVTPLSNNKDVK